MANDEVAKEGQYIATIIAGSSLFYGLNILMSQANMVDLKMGVIFKANAIAAVFNLLSNIIIFYFIQSIYIPAYTTLFSFMMASIFFYKSLNKKWIDNKIFILCIKILIISLLMFMLTRSIMFMLPTFTIIESISIKIVVAIVIYGILFRTLGIYSKEQMNNLKVMFKNEKK